jgi:hypothetical protein
VPRRRLAAAAVAVAALAGAAAAGAHFGTEVRATGSCSGTSRIGIVLDVDDGRLHVTLVVQQRRGTGRWTWSLYRNGAALAKGTAAAVGGKAVVRRTFAAAPAKDAVRAEARRAAETCRVRAAI